MDNPPVARCPDSPNCVSTTDDRPQHAFDPLPITRPADEVIEAVVGVLNQWSRTEVVARQSNRIEAVCTTAVFRFKDDVTVALDADQKWLHLRSASRLGHYDFGVNRRRVQKLAEAIRDRV